MKNARFFYLLKFVVVSLVVGLLAACSSETPEEKLMSSISVMKADTAQFGQEIRNAVYERDAKTAVFMTYAFAHPIYTSRFLSGAMMGSAVLRSAMNNSDQSAAFESAAQMAMVAIGLDLFFGSSEESEEEIRERDKIYSDLAVLADEMTAIQQNLEYAESQFGKKLAELQSAEQQLLALTQK